MDGFLRVYFVDEAWTTIPVTSSTPSKTVCLNICRKRNIPAEEAHKYALFVSETNQDQRMLDQEEFPYEVDETVRKHGQLDHYKLLFKLKAEHSLEGRPSERDQSSGSEEEGMFPAQKVRKKDNDCVWSGYLNKRGKRNRAWRWRWFVLQEDGRLLYFKTHSNTTAISSITLEESEVRETPDRNAREYLFEINNKQRVFYLRASDHNDMVTWILALKRHTELERENRIFDRLQVMLEDIETAKAEADAMLHAEISHLAGCLRNPVALDHFMQYVMANHCEENLLFWVDAQDYATRERTADQRIKRGMAIFEKFVRRGADLEIAVTGEIRDSILCAFQAGGEENIEGVFTKAQAKSFAQMESGVFPNFKAANHFQQALLNMCTVGSLEKRLSVGNEPLFPIDESRTERKKHSAGRTNRSKLAVFLGGGITPKPTSPRRGKRSPARASKQGGAGGTKTSRKEKQRAGQRPPGKVVKPAGKKPTPEMFDDSDINSTSLTVGFGHSNSGLVLGRADGAARGTGVRRSVGGGSMNQYVDDDEAELGADDTESGGAGADADSDADADDGDGDGDDIAESDMEGKDRESGRVSAAGTGADVTPRASVNNRRTKKAKGSRKGSPRKVSRKKKKGSEKKKKNDRWRVNASIFDVDDDEDDGDAGGAPSRSSSPGSTSETPAASSVVNNKLDDGQCETTTTTTSDATAHSTTTTTNRHNGFQGSASSSLWAGIDEDEPGDLQILLAQR